MMKTGWVVSCKESQLERAQMKFDVCCINFDNTKNLRNVEAHVRRDLKRAT